MSNVAVVILNYNGANFLKQFLPTVLKHSKGCRVIVSDNASTDDSIALLERDFPEVEIHRMDENLGYAGGYNKTLQDLDADIFVLLNSDVEVTENWIEPVVELLESNPTYAAAQPKLLDYNIKDHFEYAGAAGGCIDIMGYPFCHGRIFEDLEVDKGQYEEERKIFWASGACLFIKKEAFMEAGMLDRDFFAHQEEIDLCWRLQNLGYSIWYTPKSVIYHVGGGTLHKSNPKKTFLNIRNNLAMILKNLGSWQILYRFPLRILLDCLVILSLFAQKKAPDAIAVTKAHVDFWKNLTYWIRKRKTIKRDRKRKLQGVYYGSILFKHLWQKIIGAID